jgi:hypothetical protein
VRDQVSHPYRTTGKITALHTLNILLPSNICMVIKLSSVEGMQHSRGKWEISETSFVRIPQTPLGRGRSLWWVILKWIVIALNWLRIGCSGRFL